MRAWPLLVLVGCVQSNVGQGCFHEAVDPLTAIAVKSARLTDLTLLRAVAVAGPVTGYGTLRVVDTDGISHSYDVALNGRDIGVALEADGIVTFGPAPLTLPTHKVSVRDLLNVYRGIHASAHVGLGGGVRTLTSDADVSLTMGHLGLGIGATPLAFEEVAIDAVDDPLFYGCGSDADCGSARCVDHFCLSSQ